MYSIANRIFHLVRDPLSPATTYVYDYGTHSHIGTLLVLDGQLTLTGCDLHFDYVYDALEYLAN